MVHQSVTDSGELRRRLGVEVTGAVVGRRRLRTHGHMEGTV